MVGDTDFIDKDRGFIYGVGAVTTDWMGLPRPGGEGIGGNHG